MSAPAAGPVTRLLDDAVAAFPEAGAVTFAGRTLTYRALASDVDRLAAGLRAAGVTAGEQVALALPNCPQHVIAMAALWRLGATAVECNPLATADELRDQLVETAATVVICLDHVLAAISAVRADTKLRTVVVTSLLDYYPPVQKMQLLLPLPEVRRRRRELAAPLPSDADILRWTQLLRSSADAGQVQQAEVDPDAVAVIVYTGGTVTAARPTELSHANLIASARQLDSWFGDLPRGREVTLGVLPMFHAFGLVPSMLLTMLWAGRLVLLPRFDPDLVFAAIDREQPSYLPGVPPMFRSLLASPRLQSHDLRSLRRCLSIGSRLPAAAVLRFERLSGARLVEAYGLTEATSVTHAQPVQGTRRPGSIGLPLADTQARIVDARDPSRVLDTGERGELAIRGPQVGVDDWLLTGDLAVVDEDGWFTFVERKADVATAGLLKVVPGDIERELFELPGVEDCVVVGAADGRRTTIVALVVPAPGAVLDEDTVRAHLTDRLPAKHVPAVIEFRAGLPRSVVGHARRRDLVSLPQTPRRSSTSSEHPPERSRSAEQTRPASPDSP